jgi:hypothetical protein
MAHRKSPYPDKPYAVSEDARRRLEALMAPEVREKVKVQDKWVPKGGWQLWRWDTLEDVNFD